MCERQRDRAARSDADAQSLSRNRRNLATNFEFPGERVTRSTMSTIEFTVNDEQKTIEAPPMKRLLDVLREDLGLTGAKEGCGEGECGSCAVLMSRGEGPAELVNSCLVPVLQAEGARITTIEGLTPQTTATLHSVQQCFLEHGGAQCGICTPGMILAAHHLLTKFPQPTLTQIQEGLAGNLCRCTGYMRIFEAVRQAAEDMAGQAAQK